MSARRVLNLDTVRPAHPLPRRVNFAKYENRALYVSTTETFFVKEKNNIIIIILLLSSVYYVNAGTAVITIIMIMNA